jgi:hypothetical protein
MKFQNFIFMKIKIDDLTKYDIIKKLLTNSYNESWYKCKKNKYDKLIKNQQEKKMKIKN